MPPKKKGSSKKPAKARTPILINGLTKEELSKEQPPKKKGSSKKPAKARTPILINGLTKEELSKEQMEEHISRLREELDREREERNYFQLERDKIHNLREVTERRLEETKARLKKLDKEIEDDEARHRENIKVYEQKIKHLLCEHQNTVCELRADGLVSAEAAQIEQKQTETKLHKEMRAIMVDMHELQIENPVKELKMKFDEEMTATKNKWEKHIAELADKQEEKKQMLQQALENLSKSAVSEIEDQWSSLIATEIENHQEIMGKIHSALDQDKTKIAEQKAIKKQIEHLQTMQTEKERKLIPLLQDNNRLLALISKANQENADLQKKLRHYSDKTDTMEKIKAKELKALKCEHETLKQRFSKLLQEKDEIRTTFAQRSQKMQQESDAKCMQQEKEVEALLRSVEETQAQLSSVLSAPNMDHTALKVITDKVTGNLDAAKSTNVMAQRTSAFQGVEGFATDL